MSLSHRHVTVLRMRRHTTDTELAPSVARQFGAFSRHQVFASGGSQTVIRKRLRSGIWIPLHAGVYAVAGSPDTLQRQIWAAHLAIGLHSVISHELSLALSGVQSVPSRPFTFTVPHGGHHRIAGAVVHQIDDLESRHTTSWKGVRITTPARAAVEVAATLPFRLLGDVLDEAVITRRITTYERISAVLLDVARPGKPGVDKLARLLHDRLDGEPVPDSILERDFFAALEAGGLPRPERRVELPNRGEMRGIVDAMYTDARVILEVDGRRWHDRNRDRKRDYDRDMTAARSGYQTLRFVHEHVRKEPSEVCETIADVRAVRLAAAA